MRWWVLLVISLAYFTVAALVLGRPVTRGLIWHLFAFVVLTGLFHGLFIWVFPFTLRDWKAVDYIWLAFAGLAVIDAAGESRRLQAGWTQAEAHARATSTLHHLKEMASWDTAYFCKDQWRPRPGEAETNPITRDFPRMCTWSRELASRLPDSVVTTQPEDLFAVLPSPPEVDVRTTGEDVREIMALVRIYEDERAQLLTAVTEREEDDIEITFKITSGFLVVFALALRITKVTGELRPDSRHANEQEDLPGTLRV